MAIVHRDPNAHYLMAEKHLHAAGVCKDELDSRLRVEDGQFKKVVASDEQQADVAFAVTYHLQAAQVHALLATAKPDPVVEDMRGPVSATGDMYRLRPYLDLMGMDPDEWELSDREQQLQASE